MNEENAVKKIIYGVAIGDAAGCPVQFFKREDVKKLNITDMVGHGTYNKPAGTWTDDTSMTLAIRLQKSPETDVHFTHIF